VVGRLVRGRMGRDGCRLRSRLFWAVHLVRAFSRSRMVRLISPSPCICTALAVRSDASGVSGMAILGGRGRSGMKLLKLAVLLVAGVGRSCQARVDGVS
jgi:hypothetical protein